MEEIIMWIGFVVTHFFIWRSVPLIWLTNKLISKFKPRYIVRTLIECDFCQVFWISVILVILGFNPLMIPIGLLTNSILNKSFDI